MSSRYFAISAPSGTGKTTICKALKEIYKSDLHISVSYTTREKRPGEIDKQDYNFVSNNKFEELIKENKLLEWEKIYDKYYYGTPKDLPDTKIILFDIDVKGALSIKKHDLKATLIFLKAPSIEELKNRLKKRGHDEEFIQNRLKRYEFEFDSATNFDYILTNDKLDLTINLIKLIIENKIQL